MYGRWQEEDDYRDNPIHHHRSKCMPRLISAAIMWLAVNLWDF